MVDYHRLRTAVEELLEALLSLQIAEGVSKYDRLDRAVKFVDAALMQLEDEEARKSHGLTGGDLE